MSTAPPNDISEWNVLFDDLPHSIDFILNSSAVTHKGYVPIKPSFAISDLGGIDQAKDSYVSE